MKEQDIFDQPQLKDMDPKKKEIILTLVSDSKGKPLTKCLPYIMKANSSLKAQGLAFTPEETQLLMELLTKDMSPAEQSRVEMMKKMFNGKQNS